jgi:membrane protease YdiL (CAAX protease family)
MTGLMHALASVLRPLERQTPRFPWSAMDDVSPGAAKASRSPGAFIFLVFVLSFPLWAVGAASGRQLTADLPVSSFIWITPVIAASLLVYRADGPTGLAVFLRQSVDYERIRTRWWYVAALLPPGIYALTLGVMRVRGMPLPASHVSLLAVLGWFVGFFIAAECEELGWSGYALEPLQVRWSALGAGILLGSAWAGFHLVPLVQAHRSPSWIAWWSLATVALRVLIVWLYNNTGQSVFATALFHATGNLAQIGPVLDFGPTGYSYDAQRISALILVAVAAIVVVAWGPRTLTRSPVA